MNESDPRRLVRAWLPTVELLLAALAGAWWYMQGGAIWYAGPWPGPLPLILLGAMWVLRLIRTRGRIRFTAFALPLALFLVSTGVGLWAAYDPGPAWAKAWLIVGAVGIYQALAGQPDFPRLYVSYGFWALFGVVLTLYFLMTNDWSAYTVKVPVLTAFGQALSEALPALTAHRIHPNVVGGMLAVVLPLYVPLIVFALRGTALRGTVRPRFGRLLTVLTSLGMAVALLGWLVTTSRGAWIAAAGAGALWTLWRLVGRWGSRFAGRRRGDPRAEVSEAGAGETPPVRNGGGLVAFAVLVILGAAAVAGAGAAILAYDLPGAGQLANRLRLLQLGALLARDVPFTGVGLGMFEIPFSIYTLLIHVGYINHSHNMLLDMAIEQGVLGAAAYLGMVGYWILDTGCWMLLNGRHVPLDSGYERSLEGGDVTPARGSDAAAEVPNGPVQDTGDRSLSAGMPNRLLVEAPLASLVALLIHGLVDDALYGSRGALLLFVPFGLLAAARAILGRTALNPSQRRLRKRVWLAVVLVLVLTFSAVGAIVLGRGGWTGVWHANLGAISQTRVELNVYDSHRFNELSIHDVRRQEDLSTAVAHFERAMASSASNPTACQRLTEILLARRAYDAALATIEAAWGAGHRDRVTRLLYGDALVAAGRVEEAVPVVEGLQFAQARLLGQAWGYHLAEDAERESWARAAAERVTEREGE